MAVKSRVRVNTLSKAWRPGDLRGFLFVFQGMLTTEYWIGSMGIFFNWSNMEKILVREEE